tara:strand:- start:14513 stop:15940 length:1428 start_codon:yes stop_codon:yes gene_type:complete
MKKFGSSLAIVTLSFGRRNSKDIEEKPFTLGSRSVRLSTSAPNSPRERKNSNSDLERRSSSGNPKQKVINLSPKTMSLSSLKNAPRLKPASILKKGIHFQTPTKETFQKPSKPVIGRRSILNLTREEAAQLTPEQAQKLGYKKVLETLALIISKMEKERAQHLKTQQGQIAHILKNPDKLQEEYIAQLVQTSNDFFQSTHKAFEITLANIHYNHDTVEFLLTQGAPTSKEAIETALAIHEGSIKLEEKVKVYSSLGKAPHEVIKRLKNKKIHTEPAEKKLKKRAPEHRVAPVIDDLFINPIEIDVQWAKDQTDTETDGHRIAFRCLNKALYHSTQELKQLEEKTLNIHSPERQALITAISIDSSDTAEEALSAYDKKYEEYRKTEIELLKEQIETLRVNYLLIIKDKLVNLKKQLPGGMGAFIRRKVSDLGSKILEGSNTPETNKRILLEVEVKQLEGVYEGIEKALKDSGYQFA